ncbi:MAG: hypothetical protein RI996_228 [Candidatus Parcubacteria bacterium]|jgi:hypothetical protein
MNAVNCYTLTINLGGAHFEEGIETHNGVYRHVYLHDGKPNGFSRFVGIDANRTPLIQGDRLMAATFRSNRFVAGMSTSCFIHILMAQKGVKRILKGGFAVHAPSIIESVKRVSQQNVVGLDMLIELKPDQQVIIVTPAGESGIILVKGVPTIVGADHPQINRFIQNVKIVSDWEVELAQRKKQNDVQFLTLLFDRVSKFVSTAQPVEARWQKNTVWSLHFFWEVANTLGQMTLACSVVDSMLNQAALPTDVAKKFGLITQTTPYLAVDNTKSTKKSTKASAMRKLERSERDRALRNLLKGVARSTQTNQKRK